MHFGNGGITNIIANGDAILQGGGHMIFGERYGFECMWDRIRRIPAMD